MVKHLTKKEFIEEVFDFENEKDWKFKGSKPAMIDFWAPWCGPCRMVGPVVDELSNEFNGEVNFYKVNTDDEQDISMAFGIRSIPSLLFIPMEGKPKMAAGALPKQDLKRIIEKELLNSQPVIVKA